MSYKYQLSKLLLVSAMAFSLAGCADDELLDPAANHGVTLELFAPASRSGATDDGSQAATREEATINSLYLFVFDKTDDHLALKTVLPTNATDGKVDLQLDKGNYDFYAIANMPGVSSIDTKTALLAYTNSYSADHMLEADNLPMVATTTEAITSDDQNVMAQLKFACVKVVYNIIYDAADAKANGVFVADGLKPQYEVKGTYNMSSATPAMEDATKVSAESFSKAGVPTFKYYTNFTSRYNASTGKMDIEANEDCVTVNVNDEGSTTAPTTGTKYVYRSVQYLPERYPTDAGQCTHTDLTIKYYNSSTNKISEKDVALYPGKQSGGVEQLQRGYYYEYIGYIHNYGDLKLASNVVEWSKSNIDYDANHNMLWLSKTKASVTTSDNDYIEYSTNVSRITFTSATVTVGSENVPLIIVSEEDTRAEKRGVLSFRVNPAVPIASIPVDQQEGTTTVKLTAGNIVKTIDVHYDVTPYMALLQSEVQIDYEDGAATNTKVVEWVTNLGGINTLPSTVTIQGLTVNIALSDGKSLTDAEGSFTVTPLDPGSQKRIGTMTVTAGSGENRITRTVKIIVNPANPDYRIWFRALNDTHSEKNDHYTNEWQGIKSETVESNRWYDGWGSDWSNESKPGYHNIYTYYQYSETVDGNIPDDKVWRFNGNWPGAQMTAGSGSTAGWYLHSLASNQLGSNSFNSTPVYPKPGTTRFIVTATSGGAQLHRCTHSLEPGMALFDYDDYEGWIVYDPTSDPLYEYYDDQPEVVDYVYHIYTKGKYVTQIYVNYGIADNSNKYFTLWCDAWVWGDNFPWKNSAKDADFSWSWFGSQYQYDTVNLLKPLITLQVKYNSSYGDKSYSETTIGGESILHLKGVVGNAARCIMVKFNDGTEAKLNGGRNFAAAKNSNVRHLGCAYDGSTWQEVTVPNNTLTSDWWSDSNTYKGQNYFKYIWPWSDYSTLN